MIRHLHHAVALLKFGIHCKYWFTSALRDKWTIKYACIYSCMCVCFCVVLVTVIVVVYYFVPFDPSMHKSF